MLASIDLTEQLFGGLHQIKSFLLANFGKMQTKEKTPFVADPEALDCLLPPLTLKVCNIRVYSVFSSCLLGVC